MAEDLERVAFLHRDRCGVEQDRGELYKLFPILRQRCNQPRGNLSSGE